MEITKSVCGHEHFNRDKLVFSASIDIHQLRSLAQINRVNTDERSFSHRVSCNSPNVVPHVLYHSLFED